MKRSIRLDVVKVLDKRSFRELPWPTALFIAAARDATTAHAVGEAAAGIVGVINALLLTDLLHADGWRDPAMARLRVETGSMGRTDLRGRLDVLETLVEVYRGYGSRWDGSVLFEGVAAWHASSTHSTGAIAALLAVVPDDGARTEDARSSPRVAIACQAARSALVALLREKSPLWCSFLACFDEAVAPTSGADKAKGKARRGLRRWDLHDVSPMDAEGTWRPATEGLDDLVPWAVYLRAEGRDHYVPSPFFCVDAPVRLGGRPRPRWMAAVDGQGRAVFRYGDERSELVVTFLGGPQRSRRWNGLLAAKTGRAGRVIPLGGATGSNGDRDGPWHAYPSWNATDGLVERDAVGPYRLGRACFAGTAAVVWSLGAPDGSAASWLTLVRADLCARRATRSAMDEAVAAWEGLRRRVPHLVRGDAEIVRVRDGRRVWLGFLTSGPPIVDRAYDDGVDPNAVSTAIRVVSLLQALHEAGEVHGGLSVPAIHLGEDDVACFTPTGYVFGAFERAIAERPSVGAPLPASGPPGAPDRVQDVQVLMDAWSVGCIRDLSDYCLRVGFMRDLLPPGSRSERHGWTTQALIAALEDQLPKPRPKAMSPEEALRAWQLELRAKRREERERARELRAVTEGERRSERLLRVEPPKSWWDRCSVAVADAVEALFENIGCLVVTAPVVALFLSDCADGCRPEEPDAVSPGRAAVAARAAPSYRLQEDAIGGWIVVYDTFIFEHQAQKFVEERRRRGALDLKISVLPELPSGSLSGLYVVYVGPFALEDGPAALRRAREASTTGDVAFAHALTVEPTPFPPVF
jgi:hypothetical protein